MRTPLLPLYLCLAVPTLASAQTEGHTYELAQAVTRAMDVNPDFDALGARLALQKASVRMRLAGVLPGASVTGTFTHRDQGVDFGGQTVVVQDELASSGSLSVPLFKPRALSDWLVAREDYAAAIHDADRQREALYLAVVQLFVEARRADALLASARTTVERRQAFEDAARARLEGGATGKAEVQRAELSRLEAQSALDRALGLREVAYTTLSVLLDLPDGASLGLVGDVGPPPMDAPKDPFGERHDLLAAKLRLDRDALATTFGWLDFVPNVDLAAGFNKGPASFRDPDGFSWQVQLRATFVLYDGGLRYGLLDSVSATTRLHAAELAALTRDARTELEAAQASLTALEAQQGTATRAVAIASDYRAGVVARQQDGAATLLDVLDAEAQLAAAEVSRETTTYDLALARWRLAHARGQLDESLFRQQDEGSR